MPNPTRNPGQRNVIPYLAVVFRIRLLVEALFTAWRLAWLPHLTWRALLNKGQQGRPFPEVAGLPVRYILNSSAPFHLSIAAVFEPNPYSKEMGPVTLHFFNHHQFSSYDEKISRAGVFQAFGIRFIGDVFQMFLKITIMIIIIGEPHIHIF